MRKKTIQTNKQRFALLVLSYSSINHENTHAMDPTVWLPLSILAIKEMQSYLDILEHRSIFHLMYEWFHTHISVRKLKHC